MKLSFTDTLEGQLGPQEVKGVQDDEHRELKYLTMEDYKEEIVRRESTDKGHVNFIYCLVFSKDKPKIGFQKKALRLFREMKEITQQEWEDKRHALLKAIKEAGFVVELVYSSTGKEILCKVGSNDARFLQEAENKEYKLELNSKAVQHVLELKAKELFPDTEITKPRNPVYLGFEKYDEEMFERIQHAGGEHALPLYLKNDFSVDNPEKDKIDLATARAGFLEFSKGDPFKHLHMKYDKDWEERIIREHKVQLYRTYNDGTILRTGDRINLCLTALLSDPVSVNGARGAGLDLKKLQFKKEILAYFPIQFSQQTRLAGDLTADELYDLFKWKWKIPYLGWTTKWFLPWRQPIQDVRDYAGEKIAYYFAFLEFYSFWLIPTAIFGLIVYCYQISRLHEQTGSRDIVTGAAQVIIRNISDLGLDPSNVTEEELETAIFEQPFTTSRTPFAVSTDGQTILYPLVPTEVPLLIPLYSLVIALWAAFFLEFWKRHQASLAYRWGVSDYERTAEVRPEFQSDYDVPDVVTGLPTPYRSPLIFGLKIGFSISFVFSAVVITVAAFAATYVFKAFMSQSALDPTIATQIALILNAVAIMVLAMTFKTVATKLTQWENHRTDIEYEDMLIGKTFVFSFFNSYTTLLYFAFVRKGQNLPPGDQTQYCIADLQLHDKDNFDNPLAPELFADEGLIEVDSCYSALGYSLMIIFVTQIFVNNAIELGTPKIKKFMKNYFNFKALQEKAQDFSDETLMKGVKGMKDVAAGTRDFIQGAAGYHETEEKAPEPEDTHKKKSGRPLKSPAEVQFLLQPYDTPFDDYLELALQFGYVTLFVAAFPLAPTLALLNNMVEVWVDSEKVCILSRRPNMPRAQDIGTWLYIFTILSYLAIVINAGVLLFTSVEIIPLKITRPEDRVWCFLGFIIGVFLIKYFTDFFVSDVPQRIKVQLERQKYIEQKIFYDDEDDSEKYIAIAEVKERDDADEVERTLHDFKVLDEDPYLAEIVKEFRTKLSNYHKFDEEELFKKLDKNKSGDISLGELKKALLSEEIGFGQQMEPFAVKLVVDSLDMDGDGKITKDEMHAFLNDTSNEV